jgi:hypothetical protein
MKVVLSPKKVYGDYCSSLATWAPFCLIIN